MTRVPGPSVRLKLTLSYAALVIFAGGLLLFAVWLFLLRGRPNVLFVPDSSDFLRALDPSNFGPRVFLPAAILALALLLTFGLLGGWILAGRMLAPLTRITAVTRATTATGSLAQRIELPGRRDEFAELADAYDAMLARLEEHVAEQRRFAANASHELRTPLAITKVMLDVAAADPAVDATDLVHRLRVVNTRAIHLTEALLDLSLADRQLASQDVVELSLIVDEATETLLPLAEKNGVDVEIAGHPACTVGSPTLLRQLVSNLLHNAIVHNLAEGGNVRITTNRRPGFAVLTVQNTGETLAPELVATLAEPFRRGNDRVHDDSAGAGLGLTIAQRITRAHGGSLTMTARPHGGLDVSVQLPEPPVGRRDPDVQAPLRSQTVTE